MSSLQEAWDRVRDWCSSFEGVYFILFTGAILTGFILGVMAVKKDCPKCARWYCPSTYGDAIYIEKCEGNHGNFKGGE